MLFAFTNHQNKTRSKTIYLSISRLRYWLLFLKSHIPNNSHGNHTALISFNVHLKAGSPSTFHACACTLLNQFPDFSKTQCPTLVTLLFHPLHSGREPLNQTRSVIIRSSISHFFPSSLGGACLEGRKFYKIELARIPF